MKNTWPLVRRASYRFAMTSARNCEEETGVGGMQQLGAQHLTGSIIILLASCLLSSPLQAAPVVGAGGLSGPQVNGWTEGADQLEPQQWEAFKSARKGGSTAYPPLPSADTECGEQGNRKALC